MGLKGIHMAWANKPIILGNHADLLPKKSSEIGTGKDGVAPQ